VRRLHDHEMVSTWFTLKIEIRQLRLATCGTWSPAPRTGIESEQRHAG
jgi:hypothetical protein